MLSVMEDHTGGEIRFPDDNGGIMKGEFGKMLMSNCSRWPRRVSMTPLLT